VHYLARVKECDAVLVEQHECYVKQSYRNRCEILTANGPLALVVPVVHAGKALARDVRIDYATRWQKIHLRGIESAYKKSPFYDYYADYFLPFFEREERFLIDLNGKILQQLAGCLDLCRPVALTAAYERRPVACEDLRDVFHPKAARRAREAPCHFKPYHQTFADRFPFVPGLSVLDLLFNTGPDARAYL
jgi:hypothetical protein